MKFTSFYFLSISAAEIVDEETDLSSRGKWHGKDFCQNRPDHLTYDLTTCPESEENQYPPNYGCFTSTCSSDPSISVELTCSCSEYGDKRGRNCKWETSRSCPDEPKLLEHENSDGGSKIIENFGEYKFLETLPDGNIIANLFSFEPILSNEINSLNDDVKTARNKKEKNEIINLKQELLQVENEILQAKTLLGRPV
ncbi:Oidioi.mRNA.OKI2018_I69.chr2.g4298.t1.cds [Oikopleura dioica]|uniref:Oidioi.mRNA.OKI2018_I69.chr2.g4298.t1.cds n=1 Tax=Oikopleura dioica TaxID=34765 RepID=A0ABN7SWW4_OIKDI|nr:Oidioi.mRNA.OKI2018_I69.chr2.g4298.t1.cds [Oikopleura dioica]